VAAVAPVKDLVVHTHVHDNFGGVVHHWEKQQTHQLPFGRGDSHIPVGFGKIPIQAILNLLLPDYDGLLIMELRSRYLPDTQTSLDNLSAIVATTNYKNGLMPRLRDPVYASEYLNEAFKEGSQELFMLALRDVTKAKGMAQAAKKANLNRETMYRMLSEKGNPNL
jgi:probable addiction module antidote protein